MSDDVRVKMKLTRAGDLELREVSVVASRWEVAELIAIGAALVAVGLVDLAGVVQAAIWIGVLAALRLFSAWRRRRRVVREINVAIERAGAGGEER